MNAEQLISNMSCLTGGTVRCDGCLAKHVEYPLCRNHLAEAAVDQINRQKAEIERLRRVHKKEVKRIYDDNKALMQYYRYEVIKDFAERLKEKADKLSFQTNYYVDTDDIDNLVKEITEEKDNAGKID